MQYVVEFHLLVTWINKDSELLQHKQNFNDICKESETKLS